MSCCGRGALICGFPWKARDSATPTPSHDYLLPVVSHFIDLFRTERRSAGVAPYSWEIIRLLAHEPQQFVQTPVCMISKKQSQAPRCSKLRPRMLVVLEVSAWGPRIHKCCVEMNVRAKRKMLLAAEELRHFSFGEPRTASKSVADD